MSPGVFVGSSVGWVLLLLVGEGLGVGREREGMKVFQNAILSGSILTSTEALGAREAYCSLSVEYGGHMKPSPSESSSFGVGFL